MQRREKSAQAPNRRTRKSGAHRGQSEFVASENKNVPVRIEYPHPLTWWRTRSADEFRISHIAIARSVLKKSAIIGVSHWFHGVNGDAAVALGVATRIRKQPKQNPISLDLAMTAVLCVALEGDAAATMFLSAALEPISHALSDSWLTDEGKRLKILIRISRRQENRPRSRA